MNDKKKKVRVELRKNRSKPPARERLDPRLPRPRLRRRGHPRRRARPGQGGPVAAPDDHRGRHRPGRRAAAGSSQADRADCRPGRVIRVHGLASVVEADDGTIYPLRRPPAAQEPPHRRAEHGHHRRPRLVPAGRRRGDDRARRAAARRADARLAAREHVLVANVDQVGHRRVAGGAGPEAAPDRPLPRHRPEGRHPAPILCLNKADLVDPVRLPAAGRGVYSQLGVPTLLTSRRRRGRASTGCGSCCAAGRRSSRGRAASASRRC